MRYLAKGLPKRSISTSTVNYRRNSDFRFVGTSQENIEEIEAIWFPYYFTIAMGVFSLSSYAYYMYYQSRAGERFAAIELEAKTPKKE
uniref:Uncharacterized protein n=1 Tax=Tetranychus urticae TaxID=32264 RepID=T1JS75_TETUR